MLDLSGKRGIRSRINFILIHEKGKTKKDQENRRTKDLIQMISKRIDFSLEEVTGHY